MAFEFVCPVPAAGGEVVLRVGPDGFLVLMLRRVGRPGWASIPLDQRQAEGLSGALLDAVDVLETLEFEALAEADEEEEGADEEEEGAT
jgi:hypothetical protein